MPRDEQRATIRDVAARAGVSVATVSRVLSGAYQPPAETRDRVMEAVRELDYVISSRTQTSLAGTIAVVMNSMTSEFFMNIAAGVEEQAIAAGRVCLVCSTRSDAERELSLIRLLLQRGVDAVILIGGIRETPEHRSRLAKLAGTLQRSGARLVLCGRPWLGSPSAPITVVDHDAEGGGYAATSYLLSAGHRRIAHLGGPHDYVTAERRADGYRRALREFGIEPDPALMSTGGMGRESGYKDGARILAETGATAIFAANDVIAAGALTAARDAGRTVPSDLSLVGFDDVSLAQDLWPPLTTVHVPQRELGREAARRAMYPADDESAAEHVTLGTHIVVRQSVAHVATGT